MLSRATQQPLYTKAGIYLGEVMTAPLDQARFSALFGRIARGLFHHYAKGFVPPAYPTEVFRIMPWDFAEVWQSFSQLHFKPCRPLGDVFDAACLRVQEDPLSTLWLMSFYGGVHFSVSVINPALEPSRGA